MAVVKSNDILGTGTAEDLGRAGPHPAGRGQDPHQQPRVGSLFLQHPAAQLRRGPAGSDRQADRVGRGRPGDGGGITGQADACKLGIARALKKFDEQTAVGLRDTGLLTRDGRMKERKKYGLRGARRGTQFSKRYR